LTIRRESRRRDTSCKICAMRRLVLFAIVAAFTACARPPRPLPTPVASVPQFPEFIVPVVPPDLAGSPAAGNQVRGWRFLQTGDFRSAERELEAALKVDPGFYPAEAAFGWVELARKDAKAAVPHFDRALERQHRDVSALVGRGQALLALNQESEALAAFEAALAVDSSLTDLGRRVEVLRFRRQQEDLARAREAARTGHADEAVSLYVRAIASSPDSAFLYRELASVERQQGVDDRALEHFRKAIALDPPDPKSLAQVGAILDARGDLDGAAKAYTQALAAEPNDEVEAKLESARARAEVARLPEEYRGIGAVPQMTRADLAALVGVRLAPLVQVARGRDAVLITDIRNNWAANWIIAVAQAGVMEPFANHAFQPRAVVRRIDLAQVVSRLLGKVAEASPGPTRAWQSARVKFADISAGHLAYLAASAAVASGVMTVGANNTFQPSRPVSGREAIEAVDRIEAMARASGTRDKGGR
jgi:tetratricopeptide (TPR) repeat protein